jgi:hypothetical protein
MPVSQASAILRPVLYVLNIFTDCIECRIRDACRAE